MQSKTEQITINLTPEQKKRVKNKAKEGPYSGMSAYVRSMMQAGESNIADLDPRTSDHSTGSNIDTLAEAVNEAGTKILLNQLTEEPQEIDKVLEEPTTEFQTELAQLLKTLSEDSDSPIQHDPLKGYYHE
jgi:Arc/MetJ-type ribon-helix-helix transcriptional regulator